jgi:hypothetical protein
MAKTKSTMSHVHSQSSREQDIAQSTSQSESKQQVLQSAKQVAIQRIEPRYPSWPTSKPGPLSTSPLAGTRSINPFRPEQVTQVGHNPQTGQSSVDSPQYAVPEDTLTYAPASFEQSRTAQDELGKRKQRL